MSRIAQILTSVLASAVVVAISAGFILTLTSVGVAQEQESEPMVEATQTQTQTPEPESPVGHHKHHINNQTHNSITVNFTFSEGWDKLGWVFVEFVDTSGDWTLYNHKFDRSEIFRINDTNFRISITDLQANRGHRYRIVLQEKLEEGEPVTGRKQHVSKSAVAWTRPDPTVLFSDPSYRATHRARATALGTEVGPHITSTVYPESGAQEVWLPGTPTPALSLSVPDANVDRSGKRVHSTPKPRAADPPASSGDVCGSFEHGHVEGLYLDGKEIPTTLGLIIPALK